jgi:xanthine dehydrogenase/oxidase
MWGPVRQDEPVFVDDVIVSTGQFAGIIVADSQLQAQEAAWKVKVVCEDLQPILTIEEAIQHESYIDPLRQLERGDLAAGFAASDHIFTGEMRMGGQEQFYLETQGCLVIPKEDEIEIFSSTQNAHETQLVVAHTLHIPANRVVCRVKRLGGGFGGKESRSIPLAAAVSVAAYHMKRPIRCMLDRDEDMMHSGQRHPFLGKYKIGVDKDGKIQALDAEFYCNAGYSADLTFAVLERAMTHVDNTYYIPNTKVTGRVCRTNTPSNTAFRGFGGPQGMIVTEAMMSEVADKLNMSQETFREINFYKAGQATHFNQTLTDWHFPTLWKDLLVSSEYEERRAQVDAFNTTSTYKKRGLCIIPTKYGLSFTARFLNQAGALVHIYTDGSVLLTHGGVEMGQGLHTKMAQVCAEELQTNVENVFISETATNTVANTSATAASVSSDLNGAAIKNACDQLNERLAPFRHQMPDASLAQLAKAAYFERVNLSANGFYRTPDLDFDWDKNEGQMYFYFTTGAAVTEVELDVLSGDHTILRTDIKMDIGKSLNYAIDIGQIEGAFIQGVGWCTLEETLFFPNGNLFTKGPGNYKLPGFRDIPQDFRVSLLKNAHYEHLKTIQSSKGIGEPPLFLGSSVLFALRDAVKAARREFNNDQVVTLTSPATAERLRLAVNDFISDMAKEQVAVKEDERDWVVMI